MKSKPQRGAASITQIQVDQNTGETHPHKVRPVTESLFLLENTYFSLRLSKKRLKVKIIESLFIKQENPTEIMHCCLLTEISVLEVIETLFTLNFWLLPNLFFL